MLSSCLLSAASRKLGALHQDEHATFLVFAWHTAEANIDFAMASHQRRRRAGSFRQEEDAAMTLRMRLNVLAAVISFAFLTAIVVGML